MSRAATIDQPAALRPRSWTGLRTANLIVGLLHALQAATIAALSTDFALPVTGAFLDGPPGEVPLRETLFSLPVGFAVAAFLALAAADHLALSLPATQAWYERRLGARSNPLRWTEYSVSASLMLVLIAMLAGITDIGALIGIFALSAGMIACGALMERYSRGRDVTAWGAFWLGGALGLAPWIVIGAIIVGAELDGSVPGFVYGIFLSLFALYNVFALNMYLQHRGVGRWRSYRFGEATFIALSLVAKSLLAWQVFASTLVA